MCFGKFILKSSITNSGKYYINFRIFFSIKLVPKCLSCKSLKKNSKNFVLKILESLFQKTSITENPNITFINDKMVILKNGDDRRNWVGIERKSVI